MDLSIVSGTFNRLKYLKGMVESIRQSFVDIYGLSYEIVLVDGGSTDGTIEWCENQPDIKLIRHASLMGAVKAFNDGALNATGNYVVLANDDIEFIDRSVLVAYIFMQSVDSCGMGCFLQDRNGKDFHVEHMPVVHNGKQSYGPYGQVCIVPRWLGDMVKWWGDYLHTYGGDNEITSNIYELGFKVLPIEDAKIHDKEAKDDLRKINNEGRMADPKKSQGHHPDSWAWGKKWRDNIKNVVGPIVRPTPMFEDQVRIKERILYLPIYEQGWDIQKKQKHGLRDALQKKGIVREYDYVSRTAKINKNRMILELRGITHQLNPTLILTQLHNGDLINAEDITYLKGLAPLARFVNWNGDYWPENLLSKEGLRLAKAFDLQTTINRDVLDEYEKLGIDAEYWQIGWEPDGVGHQAETFCDVCFLGTGYSEDRQKFIKFVRSIQNIDFHLYGAGWPNDWTMGQNLYNFSEGCKVYQGAKISLGDSQWPETGFVSNRVMQALAAGGAALAHQWFKGMDQLGLVDGETAIIWKSFEELKDKVYYYLDSENERKKIAEQGQKLALEKHSFDNRVSELFGILGAQVFEETTEEHWRW